MTCFVSHTTVDCRDAFRLAEFWKAVLGYVDGYIDTANEQNQPGDEECPIHDAATGHTILFLEVPDPTPGKNKLNFDLRPRAGLHRDEEVQRVLGLGGTLVADLRATDSSGTGWVTLADPEGNQFCILRSDAERSVATI